MNSEADENIEEDKDNFNNNQSLSLIDSYKTSYKKNKNLRFNKINYKQNLYKKRIHYGRLSMIGIVNDELRLFPALELDLNDSNKVDDSANISNFISMPDEKCLNSSKEFLPPLDENFFNKMLNDSNLFLYTRESKREIKLKKMLEDKMRKLMYIINNKKN